MMTCVALCLGGCSLAHAIGSISITHTRSTTIHVCLQPDDEPDCPEQRTHHEAP
jgi:hypothetical protein